MVNIADVRNSNSSLTEKPPGMVALFVGGTSGIGKGTLKQFSKYANAPRVYIVGRSESSATPLLKELQSLNPQGTFNFIESQISLIGNVDKVCEEIKKKERKMDLIFLSPGYLTLEGRQGKFQKLPLTASIIDNITQETAEGIDTLSSLNYYARLRTIHNLLPL